MRRRLLPWHRFLGQGTVVLALCTMAMGLFEKQTFLKDPWGRRSLVVGGLALLLIPLPGVPLIGRMALWAFGLVTIEKGKRRGLGMPSGCVL